jgi:hypothetical protein
VHTLGSPATSFLTADASAASGALRALPAIEAVDGPATLFALVLAWRAREAGEALPPPFGCKPISPPHLNAVVGRYTAPQPLLLRPLGRKLAHASKTSQDSCLIALGIR